MTPPNDAVGQQLDDMRRLLGTVVSQNTEILNETARRRSFDVQLSPRGPSLRRIEDLLRRALLHLGDSEIAAELDKEFPYGDPYPHSRPGSQASTDQDRDREDSMYPGSEGMYTDDINPRAKAPANSFTDSYARRRRGRFSAVPESLLDGDVSEPGFDEEFAMRDLPPQTPPAEYIISHTQAPASLARRPAPQRPATASDDGYTEYGTDEQDEPQQDQTPVPYRQNQQSDQGQSQYSDEYDRRPATQLPAPLPVDVPTPVRSPNIYSTQMGPSYGGVPPPPPGMADMMRPSLPRIAGVRDPISTT